MAETDWEIPRELQPDPADCAFDLAQSLRAVIGLKANVPMTAFTARTLGTEREGSGVILQGGLVLTMGYLITEAETIWLLTADGRAVAGDVLGTDQDTGFGLVQPLGRLEAPSLELGQPESVAVGSAAIFAAAGGLAHTIETRIIARQEFAGYWEYLIDDAIFIAPAHPSWGGGALLGADGRLLGIGSLILQHGDGTGRRGDMNMVVPVSLLRPVLDDLVTAGRVRRPPRPWLGLYAVETGETIVVRALAEGGPAMTAGVRAGDRIVGVGEQSVSDLSGLWQRIWAAGPPGAAVTLKLRRERRPLSITVNSAERAAFLRGPRLH
jgi:S1-C subfamily serine protease